MKRIKIAVFALIILLVITFLTVDVAEAVLVTIKGKGRFETYMNDDGSFKSKCIAANTDCEFVMDI